MGNVTFWTCGVLCLVYIFTLTFMMWCIDRFKHAKLPFKIKGVFWAGLYSLLMSLPAMPFVHAPMEVTGFTVKMLSFFAFSSFVWQTVFLSIKYKAGVSKFLLPLSVSNVIAWSVMCLVNMYWFGAIASQMTVLLVRQSSIV